MAFFRSLFATVLVVVGIFSCSCDSSEDLDRLIEDARVCAPDDTCVITNISDCICSWSVLEARLDEVNEAIANHDCGGMTASCAELTNPHCEEGLCTGD